MYLPHDGTPSRSMLPGQPGVPVLLSRSMLPGQPGVPVLLSQHHSVTSIQYDANSTPKNLSKMRYAARIRGFVFSVHLIKTFVSKTEKLFSPSKSTYWGCDATLLQPQQSHTWLYLDILIIVHVCLHQCRAHWHTNNTSEMQINM